MASFQPFNDLSASQFEALKRDVEARGIVNPILVDENDKTIDGHQRRKVAAELSIECPRIVVEGLSDDEKMSLAIALNTFRRHLSGVERSIALQKMAQLGMSQRRIAEATGVSRRTVERDLAKAGGADAPPANVDPETGEIVSPTGDTTPEPRVVGKDGKSYPATKPKAEPTDLDRLSEQVSKSDVGYRAATSREFSKVRSGLLTLDVERVAAVCLPEDRAAYQALADDVAAWARSLSLALEGDKHLRSVK